MNPIKSAIIYFLRVPTYNEGKTRLRNFLSLEEIHRMSQYLVKKNYELLNQASDDLYLFIPKENTIEKLQELLPVERDQIYFQIEGSLGEQMYTAISDVSQLGYNRILLSGSDLFNLTDQILTKSFQALEDHDVVLTPSVDGGMA